MICKLISSKVFFFCCLFFVLFLPGVGCNELPYLMHYSRQKLWCLNIISLFCRKAVNEEKVNSFTANCLKKSRLRKSHATLWWLNGFTWMWRHLCLDDSRNLIIKIAENNPKFSYSRSSRHVLNMFVYQPMFVVTSAKILTKAKVHGTFVWSWLYNK